MEANLGDSDKEQVKGLVTRMSQGDSDKDESRG